MQRHENPHNDSPVVAAVWDEGYTAGYEQGHKDLEDSILAGLSDLGRAIKRREGRRRGKNQIR